MNTPEASFLSWQQQFNTEQDFLGHLKQLKWPNGFVCSRCAHNKGTQLHCRQLTECNRCHKKASITSKGKRGRGAQGKTPVLITCENGQKKAGFISMKAVESVNF
jgi:hypothetical protein